MAAAVSQLFQSEQLEQPSLFTLLGHEDGVVAFGHDFAPTACALINILAASKQLP